MKIPLPQGTVLPQFVIGEVAANTKSTDTVKEEEEETAKKSTSDEKPMSEIPLPTIHRNASFEIPKSPSLKPALKAQANRKISMPAKLASEEPSHPLEDWFSAQER